MLLEEQQLINLINKARSDPAAYGRFIGIDLSGYAVRPALVYNPKLEASARAHSEDMRNRNYFGHWTPEGVDPGKQISNAGYNWKAYGQSIAAGWSSPGETLKGLILDIGVADLGHRKHLLGVGNINEKQAEIGVGYATGGTWKSYFTINTGFTGKPLVNPYRAMVFGWYQEYLMRPPFNNEQVWLVKMLDAGYVTVTIAKASLLGSQEFFQKICHNDNSIFVDMLYRLILNREPDFGGKAFYLGLLSKYGRTEVARLILESEEAR